MTRATADNSAIAQRTHKELRHRRSEADLPATFPNAAILAKQEAIETKRT